MKRGLAIPALVWLLLGSARAATTGPVRAAQFQLALPFAAAAAPAAPVLAAAAPALSAAPAAPTPAVLAAAPAPAAAARAGFVDPTPPEVLAAFRSGDASVYLSAARRAEFAPPEGDDAQGALYREGLEREAAERAFLSAESAVRAARAARRTKIDYEEFGRRIARGTPDPGVFRDAELKRRVLRASGYDALIGPGGRRIRLEDADDARVGRAYLNVLRAYARR